jgi:hypothetical protein
MRSEHPARNNQSTPDRDQSNNDMHEREKTPADIPRIMEGLPCFATLASAARSQSDSIADWRASGHRPTAVQDSNPANRRLGSSAPDWRCPWYVRLSRNSRHRCNQPKSARLPIADSYTAASSSLFNHLVGSRKQSFQGMRSATPRHYPLSPRRGGSAGCQARSRAAILSLSHLCPGSSWLRACQNIANSSLGTGRGRS